MSTRNVKRSLSAVILVFVCSLGLFALPAVSETIYSAAAPLSLDFGAVPVGATSAAQTFTLINVTDDYMILNDLSNYNGANTGDFAIGPCNGIGGISRMLQPNQRCIYTVTFTPTATGSRSGTLRFYDGYAINHIWIPLTGTGTIRTISADSIVIDPATPTTLYAGLSGAGVYKKTATTEWTAATTQPGSKQLKALVVKPGDSSTLYAASYGGGVYISTNSALPFDSANNGMTWAVCAGQPSNLNVVSLIIDATGKLYAGTEAGVFVSNDNCASWNALNTGLPL